MNPAPRAVPPGGRIILWDAPEDPPRMDDGVVITWNRHPGGGNVSLLDYVEQNGERFRDRFLAWAAILGETELLGKSLIEHLSLGDGFSYWWMTPLAEKSPWKSPWIKDVLRFFAFEEILAGKKVRQVVLVSRDGRLRKILAGFCKKRRLEFQQMLPAERSGADRIKTSLGDKLPHILHGFATLVRQVWIRRKFLRRSSAPWQGGEKATTIFSYFFHLEPGTREFRSRYWGEVTDLVRTHDTPMNWAHLFYPHPAVPEAGEALTRLAGFNDGATSHERHAFIDDFLSWGVVMRTLRNWIRLMCVSWRLSPAMRGTTGGAIGLWPLISKDWNSTLRGSRAVMNLFWKELFDAALSSVPHQSLGIYLWENQPWEQACLHAWRKHGHGKVVGVAHSTIRFWDLRYFGFEKHSSSPNPRPMPDVVAINGKGMREAISESGIPFEVCECEALRFGYLQPFGKSSRNSPKNDGVFRILVLGDYLPSETARMLDLLASSAPALAPDIEFTLKPHPNHLPDLSRYSGLKMNVVTEPIGELLADYHAAYSSNITSAALDAYLAGLPVIVLHPDSDLNYSPLRNRKGTHFVSDSDGFSRAVHAARFGPHEFDGEDYFHFDPDMRGWRNILDGHPVAADSAATPTSTGNYS